MSDTERRRALPAIRAAVDRLIPADAWPGAWEGGVGDYLTVERLSADRDLVSEWPGLIDLAHHLDRAAAAYGNSFDALGPDRQDRLLAAVETDPEWSARFASLRRVTLEGYYAARPGVEPAGPRMVGFDAVPPGTEIVEAQVLPEASPQRLPGSYDAIVIGSGPGGGVAAQVLAEAGKHVLLIERAKQLPNAALRGDHVHGKRNGLYWPVVGPGPGYPRVVRGGDGLDHVVPGTGSADVYGLNAMAFGGGTRIWQGMAWRFFPEDFEMASTWGNPAGASLTDWPIDYAELEPYYERAEWQLGVAGEVGPLTSRTPRHAGYPMPAFLSEPAREVLGAAADKLGWSWGAIPLALNSVPFDGRPACVRCPQCVGHACPVDAKNGSHNTSIPRAVATGRCELLFDSEVVRITDSARQATVRVMSGVSTTAPVEVIFTADVVVVSSGAVETARLLLASGLGNDHVGRHLHDHRFRSLTGRIAPPIKPYHGPGHCIATLEHVHSARIPWGGAALMDIQTLIPLTVATARPGWGADHKKYMRDDRPFACGVLGIGQEIPMPTSRVSLHESARDRWGIPAVRLAKDVHPASMSIDEGIVSTSREWLEAAGATDIRVVGGGGPPMASAAGEHSCGTVRMASSPADGATNPHGRLFGAGRVVVCDSALTPTNGSVNPTLTIIANAYRVADALLAEWP